MTDNYIRMCEEAKEIQKAYTKCNIGDYIYDKNHNWFGNFVWHEGLNNDIWKWVQETVKQKEGLPKEKYNLLTRNYIWLPTQEQLQEMTMYQDKNDIPAMKRSMYLQLEVFTNWALKQQYIFNTLQELWLAFVMKEKYNKSWLPKEQRWVKNV